MYTYLHVHEQPQQREQRLVPNKILFYFEAFVHESIILPLPPPPCKASPIAILLHVHCALHDAPLDRSFVCHTPYNIVNGNIVQRLIGSLSGENSGPL